MGPVPVRVEDEADAATVDEPDDEEGNRELRRELNAVDEYFTLIRVDIPHFIFGTTLWIRRTIEVHVFHVHAPWLRQHLARHAPPSNVNWRIQIVELDNPIQF